MAAPHQKCARAGLGIAKPFSCSKHVGKVSLERLVCYIIIGTSSKNGINEDENENENENAKKQKT